MPNPSQRVLCVQLADIGDLVLTTPALQALRQARPHDHITLLTTPHAAPIVQAGQFVDEVIVFPKHVFDRMGALLHPKNWHPLLQLAQQLLRQPYDAVIFFHHFSTRFGALKFRAIALCSRSEKRIGLRHAHAPFLTGGIPDHGFGARHQAEYWLALIQHYTAQPLPAPLPQTSVAYTAHDEQLAQAWLPPNRDYVAIHAGSGGYSRARRWNPSAFAEVATHFIRAHHASVVLVGGKDDDSAEFLEALPSALRPSVIDLTAQTTLGQLSRVLARCQLFIGADSGVMHIATATTPTVAIFGTSNHQAWQAWSPKRAYAVLNSGARCSPCSYVGVVVAQRDGCPARTCLKMVTAQQVIEAGERVLQGKTLVPLPVMHTTPTERVRILDIPIDKLTYAQLLEQLGGYIDRADRLYQVCTVNPEFVMIAQTDAIFRHILQRADLCLADGVGLLYASRYVGNPLTVRVTGSDGVPLIAERAAQQGWRLYLLGAGEGIAEQAAQALRTRHPNLMIVGTYSGSPAPAEEDALVERINATDADILFVAYGAPNQDKWIARNAPRLKVKVAMGVGGTFDYLSGHVKLAPNWIRTIGFEWLYRLIRQPNRLRRQLRLPRFVWAVLWRGKRLGNGQGELGAVDF